MTLAAAFEELNTQLGLLGEELDGLSTTVRGYKPAGDTVFEDIFGDTADEMLGRLEAGLEAADRGQKAVAQEAIDLACAWRALTTCQEQLDSVERQFFETVSYERLAPFVRFGCEQGGEWHAWVTSVKEALDRCQQPLYNVRQALFRCWQEIAERAGVASVSVQTTSIGQQIIRGARNQEVVR